MQVVEGTLLSALLLLFRHRWLRGRRRRRRRWRRRQQQQWQKMLTYVEVDNSNNKQHDRQKWSFVACIWQPTMVRLTFVARWGNLRSLVLVAANGFLFLISCIFLRWMAYSRSSQSSLSSRLHTNCGANLNDILECSGAKMLCKSNNKKCQAKSTRTNKISALPLQVISVKWEKRRREITAFVFFV